MKNPTYVSRELTECIHKMYCQLKSSADKKDVGLFTTNDGKTFAVRAVKSGEELIIEVKPTA